LIKFFEIDPLTSLLAALRVFHIGHYLGRSPNLVRLYAHTAVLVGVLKQRRLVHRLSDHARAMAEGLQDPELVSHVEAYRTFGIVYCGDEVDAEHRARAVLRDYRDVLSAENYMYLC